MEVPVDPAVSTSQQTTPDAVVTRRARKQEKLPLIDGTTPLPSGGSVDLGLPEGASEAGMVPLGGVDGEGPQQGFTGPERTLGMFGGVIVPVALSQCSSLLFLRLGYMIGNAGLLVSLAQMLLAYSILALTILSLSAISTNGAIEGGGAYFMISRTLGAEFGGTIGLIFFLANVASASLYITGCTEALVEFCAIHFDSEFTPWEQYGISLGIAILMCLIIMVASKHMGQVNMFMFATVVVITVTTLVKMLFINKHVKIPYASGNGTANATEYGYSTGFNTTTLAANLYQNYHMDYTSLVKTTFMSTFSVMFSGVTGIMAGANVSGELKSPGRAIPYGTLIAWACTLVMYALIMLIVAGTTQRDALVNNYLFMSYVGFPYIIFIGILLTTLSASISCILGASRVLKAIADDRVFSAYFTRLVRLERHPASYGLSLVWSGLLMAAVLMFGDLNTIAGYASVFFLASYTMVNLSCLCLQWAAAVNFRPVWKHFNLYTCGAGMASCLVVMGILNMTASAVLTVVFFILLWGLYQYHLGLTDEWGSVTQALMFHTVRKYLLKLDARREHVKYWRPHVLLLVANARSSGRLVRFLNDLKKGGIFILGHVQVVPQRAQWVSRASSGWWQQLVDTLKVKAFVATGADSDVRRGALQIVDLCGLGALRPNMVMLGFRDSSLSLDHLEGLDAAFPPGWQGLPAHRRMTESARVEAMAEDAEAAHRIVSSANGVSNGGPGATGATQTPTEPSGEDDDARITPAQYEGLVQDILSAGLSVGLCRHFWKLESPTHGLWGPPNTGRTVDVWPLELLVSPKPPSTALTPAEMFPPQMATVLNMVKSWRRSHGVRVMLPWGGRAGAAGREAGIRAALASMRIAGEVLVVPWEPPAEDDSSPQPSPALLHSLNSLLLHHSTSTSVVFLHIPAPSALPRFLPSLTTLTNHLPPCVMLHGVEEVTTSNL